MLCPLVHATILSADGILTTQFEPVLMVERPVDVRVVDCSPRLGDEALFGSEGAEAGGGGGEGRCEMLEEEGEDEEGGSADGLGVIRPIVPIVAIAAVRGPIDGLNARRKASGWSYSSQVHGRR